MKISTKKVATLGMLAAVAFVLTVVIHIKIVPSASFLTYDPKDAVIAIGGFIFGPVYAVLISIVVSFVEMVTISESGLIGFVMNIISTCAFTVPAGIIYMRHRTKERALLGLAAGTVCVVIVMVLWNYILTPIYTGMPREAIAKMLLPVFVPFNFIKGIINSLIAFFAYKPVINALRKNGLVEKR